MRGMTDDLRTRVMTVLHDTIRDIDTVRGAPAGRTGREIAHFNSERLADAVLAEIDDEARLRAERERDDARALAKALFDQLRDFISDWDEVFGEGLSWETLPDWLTGDRLGRALWAYGAEGGDDG